MPRMLLSAVLLFATTNIGKAALVKVAFEGQPTGSALERVSGTLQYEDTPEMVLSFRSDWENTTSNATGYVVYELAATRIRSFELTLGYADFSMTFGDTSGLVSIGRFRGSSVSYANEGSPNTKLRVEIGDYALVDDITDSGGSLGPWEIVPRAVFATDLSTDEQVPIDEISLLNAELPQDAIVTLEFAEPILGAPNYLTAGPSGALIDYADWPMRTVVLDTFVVVPEPQSAAVLLLCCTLSARRLTLRKRC